MCTSQKAPDRNITLYPVFEVDAGLVTGITVGALAGVSLFAFVLIAAIIVAKVIAHGMKPNHEALDVEMSWTVKSSDEEEDEAMRIVQQIKQQQSQQRTLKRNSKSTSMDMTKMHLLVKSSVSLVLNVKQKTLLNLLKLLVLRQQSQVQFKVVQASRKQQST